MKSEIKFIIVNILSLACLIPIKISANIGYKIPSDTIIINYKGDTIDLNELKEQRDSEINFMSLRKSNLTTLQVLEARTSETDISDLTKINWMLGDREGIRFNPDGTITKLYNSEMFANEGTATISDKDGNLLFFTDGDDLWNKNGDKLNDVDLFGDHLSCQSVIVVPMPGNENRYYIFTVPNTYYTWGLYYSVIDIRINDNQGGFIRFEDGSISKQIQANVVERIAAVKNDTEDGYWIIVDEKGTNKYFAYLITENGITQPPVISEIGSVHVGTTRTNTYGAVKFSKSGNLFVSARGGEGNPKVELFDFDKSTGLLSNYRDITPNSQSNSFYGVEFSPNENIIYVGTLYGELYRTIIDQNVTELIYNEDFVSSISGMLQIGPDGNIYWKSRTYRLLYIKEPDNPIPADQFILYSYDLNTRYGLGLPNFIANDNFECPETKITSQFSYEFNMCFTDFTAKIDNPLGCHILSYHWDFGDGSSSSEQNPRHVFSDLGNYIIHLDVKYMYDAECEIKTASYEQEIELISPAEMIENLIIEVHSKQLPGVLSASAATFSDVWNLDHLDESLNERHAFENGKLGVWRLEGNYVFEKNRDYAGNIDISKDGTYTLDYFNWPYARFDAVPNWKKVNTMTKYSPYGFETENKDILDRYSSAVYGYGGQLPTATGQNMMESEMAYAGFEDATGFENGNWKIGNEGIPEYTYIPVGLGFQQYVLITQPHEIFNDISTVDISYSIVDFAAWGKANSGYLRDVNILCAMEHDENPDWTWVILDRLVSPVNTIWFGTLNIPNIFEPVDMPVIDQTVAHTGSSSLKISETKTYKQDLLHLEKGKNYMISGWVSVNNPNLLVPNLGEGIQIEINFVREDDTKLLTENIQIQPTGNIIEGWQKIEGSFTVPEADDEITLEVTFNRGTPGLIWLDDLRLHPESGNMNSYVYETTTYRLRAVLDENNYASLYFYDSEGNLHLTKKETVRGIKTIQETNMHLKSR